MCTRSCAQKNHRTSYSPKYLTFSLEKNCSGFQNLTKFSSHSFEAGHSDWAFLDINVFFILSSKVQVLGLLYSGFLFSLHCGWWCTGFPQLSWSCCFLVPSSLGLVPWISISHHFFLLAVMLLSSHLWKESGEGIDVSISAAVNLSPHRMGALSCLLPTKSYHCRIIGL